MKTDLPEKNPSTMDLDLDTIEVSHQKLKSIFYSYKNKDDVESILNITMKVDLAFAELKRNYYKEKVEDLEVKIAWLRDSVLK